MLVPQVSRVGTADKLIGTARSAPRIRSVAFKGNRIDGKGREPDVKEQEDPARCREGRDEPVGHTRLSYLGVPMRLSDDSRFGC